MRKRRRPRPRARASRRRAPVPPNGRSRTRARPRRRAPTNAASGSSCVARQPRGRSTRDRRAEPGARGDAEQVGVGEGVAERRPGTSRPRRASMPPDERREDDARDAEMPEDRLLRLGRAGSSRQPEARQARPGGVAGAQCRGGRRRRRRGARPTRKATAAIAQPGETPRARTSPPTRPAASRSYPSLPSRPLALEPPQRGADRADEVDQPRAPPRRDRVIDAHHRAGCAPPRSADPAGAGATVCAFWPQQPCRRARRARGSAEMYSGESCG